MTVHTGPSGCRYADCPLSGGFAKNRKSTISGRLREKSTVGGRLSEKKGRRRRGKEEKKKRGEEERIPSARAPSLPAVIACVPSPPAGRQRPRVGGAFSPARGERSRLLSRT
ncbi:hypothetical protein GW17_00045748 [Ensete ventricosum]|nr:hypothetical protein GW17_00045748 [Ensete ventricosum]